MAAKLEVVDFYYRGQYRLTWFIEEEDEYGSSVGDEVKELTPEDLAAAKGDYWDVVKASLTAKLTDGVERDCDGYFWPTRKAAYNALRAVKAALKDKSDKPWPDWAVKAEAAGWKKPKGWVP